MKKYLCIESFVVDAYDDDGYIIEDGCITITKGSEWVLDEDEARVIGGEVRLEGYRDSIYSWIEITKTTFESCFEEVVESN